LWPPVRALAKILPELSHGSESTCGVGAPFGPHLATARGHNPPGCDSLLQGAASRSQDTCLIVSSRGHRARPTRGTPPSQPPAKTPIRADNRRRFASSPVARHRFVSSHGLHPPPSEMKPRPPGRRHAATHWRNTTSAQTAPNGPRRRFPKSATARPFISPTETACPPPLSRPLPSLWPHQPRRRLPRPTGWQVVTTWPAQLADRSERSFLQVHGRQGPSPLLKRR
jgi:hypothetical protein